MNGYLLDTNICIYIINEQPERVRNKLKAVDMQRVYVSSVSAYELYYGIEKSKKYSENKVSLETFLSYLRPLVFDFDDAKTAGKIRGDLERIGKLIGPYDLQIAAQALNKKLVLVTHNEREFKRVKDLKIENWA